MDAIDKKLMQELDANPKLPLSILAKNLRISQQVADYRVRRLLKKNVIQKFTPIINLNALGKEQYRIFFTFNLVNRHTNKDIFAYLKNHDGIYWSARIGGTYDLVIVLWVDDFSYFEKFINNFNSFFPNLVKGYKVCYVLEHHIYKHRYFGEDYSSFDYGYGDKKQNIDKLDFDILNTMKDNCRQSALQIGKGLAVSYKTVLNRIRAMEKNRVILGYRMYLRSTEEIKQKPFIILFSFKDYSQKIVQDLFSYIKQIKPATQSLRLFGTWDLFLHVRSVNNEAVQDLIILLRNKFSIIDRYEIIPVFEDLTINLLPIKFC